MEVVILRFITRAVDRFCVKHPRFGVQNLMLYVVIANAVVFLFSQMDRSHNFINYLSFMPSLIFSGQIWRLFTFVMIPEGSNILFVAIFLYFYYFIGNTLENTWGSTKFTVFYLSGILFTIIYGFIIWLITGSNITTGDLINAHFLNLSMFLAFATLYPETQVLLFFIIPIKVKWLALFDAVYFMVVLIRYPFPYNLLPLIAFLNYYVFCGEYLPALLSPLKYRFSKRSRNYRSSSSKTSARKYPYTHKCEVCGKTDHDYPNLEFRYCSRCEGYHCFCEEHINNHNHFKE